jgi:hypothetical protein
MDPAAAEARLGHQGAVSALSISQRGKSLVTVSWDRTVRRLELHMRRLSEPPNRPETPPDTDCRVIL